MVTQPHKPRVLMFSQRNIFGKEMFRFAHFEFENIISQIDSVELAAPNVDPSRPRYKIAKQILYHSPFSPNPGIQRMHAKQDYDLFFAILGNPTDLLNINATGNWKNVCKTSICLIDEVWANQLTDYSSYLRILEKFDVVMLYYSQTVKPLSEQIATKCVFLPPGIDATFFCPYPQFPSPVVDVYSIGRRGDQTHQRLLKMVAENALFYIYDTIPGGKAMDSTEHRALFANIAKRSRYFIVNPGLIDRPDIRGDQIEISNRYFEGAASGAILVGESAPNGQFENLLDWPDALIHLPYNSSEIDSVINELDQQPERQERIRRTNVAQALMRFDWVYRWEAILKAAGLEPMPELLQRKKRLKTLAEAVLQNATTRAASERDESVRV